MFPYTPIPNPNPDPFLQGVVLPPPPSDLLLPPAHQPFNPNWPAHSLGRMDVQCPSCHALHWMAECLTNSSNICPKFGMCYLSRKISLPPLHPPPPELMQLLTTQDQVSKTFRDHIYNYNNSLAMTSISHKVDESINNSEGPYYKS